MHVGRRNGRLVSIRPVLDAPVNKGHLCVKGRYGWDFVHAADRVTEPMVRNGEFWQPVSWDQAIQLVAERLKQIIAEYGPDAIGILGSARATNEENYVAQKFARVVIGTNNVDCCARVCHAPTAAGMKLTLGTGAATNSFDDIERARTILICGANPTENHPIVGDRIRQAVRRGAELIVIDPRRIGLADCANVHLAVQPGTNIPLLNSLPHVIVEEQLYDPMVVPAHVEGWENYRHFIADWPPERAAKICSVPADLICRAARAYATHKPAMCIHGLGVTEHVQGTDGVICLVNLATLTGNLGRAGSGVNPLRGQNNVQGAAHMGCDPDVLTGGVPLGEHRGRFEAAWQTSLPIASGMNLMEMIDAAESGRLKALWAIGYDIGLTNPNASATLVALRARFRDRSRPVPHGNGPRRRVGLSPGLLVVRERRYVYELRAADPTGPKSHRAGREVAQRLGDRLRRRPSDGQGRAFRLHFGQTSLERNPLSLASRGMDFVPAA